VKVSVYLFLRCIVHFVINDMCIFTVIFIRCVYKDITKRLNYFHKFEENIVCRHL